MAKRLAFIMPAVLLVVLGLSGGRGTTMPDGKVCLPRSCGWYLDRAGRAAVILNWGRGLRQRFLDAGHSLAGPWCRDSDT